MENTVQTLHNANFDDEITHVKFSQFLVSLNIEPKTEIQEMLSYMIIKQKCPREEKNLHTFLLKVKAPGRLLDH